ncbi:MAG: hypothetical protein AB7F43_08645 [Bacteriovoracia bacterium]
MKFLRFFLLLAVIPFTACDLAWDVVVPPTSTYVEVKEDFGSLKAGGHYTAEIKVSSGVNRFRQIGTLTKNSLFEVVIRDRNSPKKKPEKLVFFVALPDSIWLIPGVASSFRKIGQHQQYFAGVAALEKTPNAHAELELNLSRPSMSSDKVILDGALTLSENSIPKVFLEFSHRWAE